MENVSMLFSLRPEAFGFFRQSRDSCPIPSRSRARWRTVVERSSLQRKAFISEALSSSDEETDLHTAAADWWEENRLSEDKRDAVGHFV
ncbi:hypothetical protein LDENG_00220640 [Lucifuga dentata]|nr:hypothetical protein LDENG_00220640 [Lucifuga dentata]